jgi:hypothetical protein
MNHRISVFSENIAKIMDFQDKAKSSTLSDAAFSWCGQRDSNP